MTTAEDRDVGLQQLHAGLEALLFNAEEPLEVDELATVLDAEPPEVSAALVELADQYETEGRGLAIRQVAGGWRMYTAPRAYEYVERYVLAGRSGRLSQAALETLAVVAYKQPISRQEIGDVRGVNADAAVRTLAQRGFVEEVGRAEGPGQAILYGTTARFLEELGLNALDELPPLTDFLGEDSPDEPALDELATVRKRLAAGGGMTEEDEDSPAQQAAARRDARRRQEREMDELTESLERATRSAVAQLRQAVDASEADEEDESPDTSSSQEHVHGDEADGRA
ncbi:MAG: SMC-Scp complex subunit ScpB [Nitriliruptorales bacterium]|nr:SMC-Scp complex subunit ScpB [Nitriliruptorales bacterium]